MSYLMTGCNDFDFQNVILLDFCYSSPDKNILIQIEKVSKVITI